MARYKAKLRRCRRCHRLGPKREDGRHYCYYHAPEILRKKMEALANERVERAILERRGPCSRSPWLDAQ